MADSGIDLDSLNQAPGTGPLPKSGPYIFFVKSTATGQGYWLPANRLPDSTATPAAVTVEQFYALFKQGPGISIVLDTDGKILVSSTAAATQVVKQPAAPTNGQVNDVAKELTWEVNPLFPSYTQYKEGGRIGTTAPAYLSAATAYQVGNVVHVTGLAGSAKQSLSYYVAGSGSIPDGKPLTNLEAFTGTAVVTPPAGDTTAPTVTITVPAAGAVLTAGTQVLLTATATDNVAVQGLSFSNGATGAVLGQGAKNGNTYTLPYTPTTAGQLTLTATATDAAGNSQSATVNVTVQAATVPTNQAPSIALSLSTTTATAGSQVTATAIASDSDGQVVKVEFYDGNTLLGTDTDSPYAYSWTPTAGTHTITAKVYDNLNATNVSSAVTLTVTSGAKSGYNIISLGDSRVNYEGDTGDQSTTSVPALTTARLATAGRTETVLNRGYPGRTSEWALSDTSAEVWKPAGITAVNEVISQFKANMYNIVLVGFGANGNSTVEAMRQVHAALKAGGADYTIATPILNRLDAPTWVNGIQDRTAKNAAILNSKGVWSSEISHTDGVPQLYSDEAPNNPFYFWANDKVGLSKVHLTTEGNKLQAEQDAQAISRIIGFTLPPLPVSAIPVVSLVIEQDDARLHFAPAGSWSSYSYNPQYSGTYGAASNAPDAEVSFELSFYGIRVRTPRSSVASTVKLTIRDTNNTVLDTVLGTQFSTSPPQNADPLTTIVQKVYVTAAVRRVSFTRGTDANLSNTALLFDLLEFSNAAGVFPSDSEVATYLDYGGLSNITYDANAHTLLETADAQTWGVSVGRGKLLAQPTGGAAKQAVLKWNFRLGQGSFVQGFTSTGAVTDSYEDIQWGIYCNALGQWAPIENGVFKGPSGGTYAAGTAGTGTQLVLFSIEVTNVAKYYLNGVADPYTSTVAPAFPMLIKACMEAKALLGNMQLIAATTSPSAYA